MKKLLLIVVFVLGLFPFVVTQVSADNDTLNVFCDISVGGQSFSTAQGGAGAPLINASSRNGNQFFYPVRICGDTSLFSTLDAGVLPVIWYNWGNFDFGSTRPQKANLTQDGSCWVGEISALMDPSGGPMNAVLDVEGNLGEGNVNNPPLCHRVYGKMAPSLEMNNTGWDAAMNMCGSVSTDPTQPINGDDVTVKFTVPQAFWGPFAISPEGRNYNLMYRLIQTENNGEISSEDINVSLADSTVTRTATSLQTANYTVQFVLQAAGGYSNIDVCSKSFDVGTPDNPGGIIDGPGGIDEFQVCAQTGTEGSAERAACQECFNNDGIWTGVGCIPYKDTAGMVRAFITIGLGLAGTVVILMTLAGAFLMSTSRGEPQRIDEAKSLITSAIVGIFFLIFSVSILQFIGVRILQIPGFG